MHPNTLLAALTLLPLASACKCIPFKREGNEMDITASVYCCEKFHGKYDTWTNDCDAHSIKNKLNDFMQCCVAHHVNADCWHNMG